MDPKISVIMPSLNVKDYIVQCLESVINQSFYDIEIICVDAGSDDGTLEILKQYSENDSRIKILNSNKKSYGYQVNLGISKSIGEYVAIVETDDFIEKNMLKILYDLSENGDIDIVKGTFYHYDDSDENNIYSKSDNAKKDIIQNRVFTINDEPYFLDGHPSIWAGLYNRKFLQKNNIKMVEASGGGWVDNTFFYESAILAKSIKYIHKPLYYYRISNPNSSTNKFKDFTIPMKRILEIFDLIEEYNINNENLIVVFYNRLFRYIEIILENNYNSEKNLDYETCKYIHDAVKKVNEDILIRKLKFNFQKLYYKFISSSFLKSFENNSLTNEKIDIKNKFAKSHEKYKISVIMPVFNGENFIHRSVNSILNQTLDGIEIIFINDGSTDSSADIINDYNKKCNFVKVLNQSNQGSGKARNYGIKESNGEYIAFLDVDDFFMDNDALEKMYDVANTNNADMVSANIKHDLEMPGKYVPFGPFHYYETNDVILPEAYGIPWSFYKNIFKKEFLINKNIIFPDLLRGQDPVFLAEVLTKIDKIYVVATDLYAYVYNSDTAKANSYRKLHDQLLHYKMVIDYFNESKFFRRQNEYVHKIFLFISRLDDESIEDAYQAITEIFNEDIKLQYRLKNQLYLTFKDNFKFKNLLCMNPKVSIILPINAFNENILNVIKSILNQSLVDIELLLINFGLDNSSKSKLNSLVGKDNRIKLLSYELNNSLFFSQIYNYGISESEGEYLYFLNPNVLLYKNSLEELFKSAIINGSDIVLCDLPKGSRINNPEIKFKELFRMVNCDYYSFDYGEIEEYIFNSSFDLSYKFYRKNFLIDNNLFFEDFMDCYSVFHIKSILSNAIMSVVHKFLFKYVNSSYYNVLSLSTNDTCSKAMNIFDVCDNVEEFLINENLFDLFKTNFDLYKINQITKYLDSVRFVGSHTYNSNDNENEDFNYEKYYGSKSNHLGLDYSFAENYFVKVKEEFESLNYRDVEFMRLNNNSLSISENLHKYQTILKSGSYKEYCKLLSFSKISKLNLESSDYLSEYQDLKNRNIKHYGEDYSNLDVNQNILNYGNEYSHELIPVVYENNKITEEYWKNREYYDYIKGSRSWKKTKPLRDLRNNFKKR